MVYKVIGIMSGSSVDGLDIAYINLHETGGKWSYEIVAVNCYAYSKDWKNKLNNAIQLSALEYLLLNNQYGHYIGQQINTFIETNNLQRKVDLIISHGHTSFHLPDQRITAQLGDGAAIAAITQLPVVNDLRTLDIAYGGQGAPLVPIGEKLLFQGFDYYLNIGGIANISINNNGTYIAFDICAANKVLNMLTEEKGFDYDDKGKIAASGSIDKDLLDKLNSLEYYQQSFPKSLANSFGTDIIYPLIKKYTTSVEDGLRTYVEHIVIQITNAINKVGITEKENFKLLVTGGGALNTFLIERLQSLLQAHSIEVVVPDEKLIQYKEALIMALIGTLRWREEVNVLASVTGATQNSIGGALWMGGEI
ncbi:MAG: anhydro-N-acetylmuramic acid kinase [Ferruginibacter sp.]